MLFALGGRLMEMLMDITAVVLRRMENRQTVAFLKLLSCNTLEYFSSPDLTTLFQLQILHRTRLL
jgi:hypothetical protein